MENKINQEQFIEIVENIAKETTKMSQKIIGDIFPIKSLTIFAHSGKEFDQLVEILSEMGKQYNYNNGPRIELFEPIEVENNNVEYIRIRKPDIERPQIGCNDFETNYEDFKEKYLSKYPNNLFLIERTDYEMIEMKDKDFDVLAYVVSN